MLKSETIGDKELQKQRVRERYNERADPDKMFVIPATEQPINIYEDDQQRRVAVYVRVSTDSVQQTSSYELQKNYYTSFVESHPNWVLVHIYADEGISGTSLNHRDEFNAMIADCERGKIDLIVTKGGETYTEIRRNGNLPRIHGCDDHTGTDELEHSRSDARGIYDVCAWRCRRYH